MIQVALQGSNETVWLNPAHVVSMRKGLRRSLEIRMSDGSIYVVEQEIAEILRALGAETATSKRSSTKA